MDFETELPSEDDNLPDEKLNKVVKRLITIRALRSIGQGAMVVDLALYLKALHWSGAAIGAVTTGAGLFGAVLIMLVGVVSDRVGRRPFLFVYEGLTTIAAGVAALTTAGVFLSLAIVVSGFGRGQNGSAGPFMPAEQAWLAANVPMRHRGRVFSFNNAAGFLGMALGSVLAGWPALAHDDTVLADFRPIFLLVMVISLICSVLIWMTPEESRQRVEHAARKVTSSTMTSAVRQEQVQASHGQPNEQAQASQEQSQASHRHSEASYEQSQSKGESEQQIRRRENAAMLQLAAVNTLNGLAVGLTGPMMVYWFSLRYGASSAEIGSTLAVGFVLTGMMSIFSGWIAGKYGLVRSVTGMRVIGSSMMLLLPFIPNFWGASGLYALRSAINRGTQGNRSALSASIVRDERRGLSISLNALSMRLPSAIGPTITGVLFDAGWLSLPLYLTAGLQLINAWLYQRMFGRYDKTQEE